MAKTIKTWRAENPFSLEVNAGNKSLAAFKKIHSDRPQNPYASGRLRVSILDICNLNCSYCYNEGISDIKKRRISPLELELILRAVTPPTKSIKLVGGEPLIHPEIASIMAISKQYAPTTITTNGIMLDKYSADIAELGIDGITVSLDNTNPESFRALTKTSNGTYERVLRGIDALIDAGYPHANIALNTVVTSQNFSELNKIIEFATQRRLSRVNLLGLIKLPQISLNDVVSPEKIESWLDGVAGKSEYVTSTRRRYMAGPTQIDVVWQYCTVGCGACKVDGFIRVLPTYEFRYCIADGAGVPFQKELMAKDLAGIQKRFAEAVTLMGTFIPYRTKTHALALIPITSPR